MQALAQRLGPWEADCRAVLQTADTGTTTGHPLLRRTGMGRKSAGRCVREWFGGRAWHTLQEGGALRGLPPPP